MARVIVILALMLLISSLIFAVTRKPSGAVSEADAGSSTTVPLGELPDDVKSTVETAIADEKDPPVNGTATVEAASAQDVASGAVAGAAPSFATVGSDHKGRASFTGTATPGDSVSLTRDDKVIGKGVADKSGNWTVDFKLPTVREAFELHLTAKGKDGKTVTGPQRALISPPETSGGLPHITLVASELKPETKVEGNAAAGEPKVGLIVEKVEEGAGKRTALKGRADPGGTVKVALNGTTVAHTKVDSAGNWAVDIGNPTGKDAKTLKLELLGPKGVQLDEADIPYLVTADASAQVRDKIKEDLSGLFSSAVKGVDRATHSHASGKRSVIRVRKGDSLWRLARRHFGHGRQWKKFYNANRKKLENPDLIYPGQRLVLPG